MSLNGPLFEIRSGEYAATIASSGATLVGLRHAGRRITASFDARAAVGEGWEGRALAPWPNRIPEGRYSFAGVDYEVPINDHAHQAALHGLAGHQAWGRVEAAEDRVALALDLPGSLGYPFDVSLSASYSLSRDGLSVSLAATNLGVAPAPVALGSHPYLTWDDAPLDECSVQAPGVTALLVDERLAPIRLVDVAEADLDFRTPTPFAGRRVDTAFQAPDGAWAIELRHAAGGVVLRSEAPWLQLFSADPLGRRALAAEPMTHGPNAFNGPDADVALAAGASRTLRYTIAVL